MYIPAHFREDDPAEMLAFARANAFGQLLSTLDGRLFASHLPFLVADDLGTFTCHLARANPQHTQLAGQEVLVILAGPHGYISPAWYASPGVPTWNYQALHVYGRCEVFDEPARLGAVVDGLTAVYEAGLQPRWDGSYDSGRLGGVVGVEIAVSSLECKYKLGQNRPAEDRLRVARALKGAGNTALADAMTRGGDAR